MQNQTELREVAEIFERSLQDFRVAMELRDALTIRIGRRTTQIIRFSMVGMTLLMATVFYLLYLLNLNVTDMSQDMNSVSHYMEKVSNNLVLVTDNITSLNRSVENVNYYLRSMPSIDDNIQHIEKQMILMNTKLNSIDTHVGTLSTSLEAVNHAVISIDKNIMVIGVDIANLNHQFGGLSYNVNRIAAPVKMFPFQ